MAARISIETRVILEYILNSVQSALNAVLFTVKSNSKKLAIRIINEQDDERTLFLKTFIFYNPSNCSLFNFSSFQSFIEEVLCVLDRQFILLINTLLVHY